MSATYLAVTAVAAAANTAAAAVDFLRARFVLENMSRYGVPASWLPALGLAKAAGAAGLLLGIALPAIGVAASVALLVYFAAAVVTVVRARWYSHIPAPAMFLLLAAAALTVQLAA
ncbi:DoxX family protein [Phytohabitans houttuyneae]|uniref:DoxX family protein n=1 Tax=Phytohabitans houttuyneae TaxID=1076126 RepID=UPI00156551DF|nr:DoxX family protein [Phytohabitans houttuyneae]